MQKNYARLNTELEQSNVDGTYDDFHGQQTRTNLFKSNLEQSNFEGPSEIDFYEQNSRVNLLRSNLDQTNLDEPIELNFYEQGSRTDLFANNAGESENSGSESSLEPFPDIEFNRQESATEQESAYIRYETQLENSNMSLFPNAVSGDELEAMFKDMKKFQPKDIELETKFKVFIPDYIPCVLDPEKNLRPCRPDGKPETLGLDKLIESRPSGGLDLGKGIKNILRYTDEKPETLSLDKLIEPISHGLDLEKEIQDIYKYISRYKPTNYELDMKLRPFIPDYIPVVGNPNDLLQPTRPDEKDDFCDLSIIVGNKICK